MKKEITETIIDYEFSYNDINELIKSLTELRDQYKDKYSKIFIDYDYCGDSKYYKVVGKRLETDVEESTRERQEKELNDNRMEKDRKEYIRLKNIFEV